MSDWMFLRSKCRWTQPPEAEERGEGPAPIWLSALVATRCLARGNGQDRAVRWNCVSGRAVYTNAGADAELIQPFGVRLQGGHTLAVYWVPGETAYSMEVYSQ